jgi:hypothetical protein
MGNPSESGNSNSIQPRMKKKSSSIIHARCWLLVFACLASHNGFLGTRLSAQPAVNLTLEAEARSQTNPGFCFGKTGRFIPVTGLVTSASYHQAEDKLDLVVSGEKIKELLDAHNLPFQMRNFYLRFGGTSQWSDQQRDENRKLIRIFDTDPEIKTFAAVIHTGNYQRRSYFEDDLNNLKTRHDSFFAGSCNEQPVLKFASVNAEQDTPLRIALTKEGKARKPKITVKQAFISDNGEIAIGIILGDHRIGCYEVLKVLDKPSK